MLKRKLYLTISWMIAPIAVMYLAYYLLLHDNWFHTSIASIITYANHLAIKKHLLILGLLPIYIGVMIFGAVMLGMYLSPKIQYFLTHHIKIPCPQKKYPHNR